MYLFPRTKSSSERKPLLFSFFLSLCVYLSLFLSLSLSITTTPMRTVPYNTVQYQRKPHGTQRKPSLPPTFIHPFNDSFLHSFICSFARSRSYIQPRSWLHQKSRASYLVLQYATYNVHPSTTHTSSPPFLNLFPRIPQDPQHSACFPIHLQPAIATLPENTHPVAVASLAHNTQPGGPPTVKDQHLQCFQHQQPTKTPITPFR